MEDKVPTSELKRINQLLRSSNSMVEYNIEAVCGVSSSLILGIILFVRNIFCGCAGMVDMFHLGRNDI